MALANNTQNGVPLYFICQTNQLITIGNFNIDRVRGLIEKERRRRNMK